MRKDANQIMLALGVTVGLSRAMHEREYSNWIACRDEGPSDLHTHSSKHQQ
jgi:hypothetical protein